MQITQASTPETNVIPSRKSRCSPLKMCDKKTAEPLLVVPIKTKAKKEKIM